MKFSPVTNVPQSHSFLSCLHDKNNNYKPISFSTAVPNFSEKLMTVHQKADLRLPAECTAVCLTGHIYCLMKQSLCCCTLSHILFDDICYFMQTPLFLSWNLKPIQLIYSTLLPVEHTVISVEQATSKQQQQPVTLRRLSSLI